MVQRRHLHLTNEERDVLVQVRDHDKHPQMRERCAALLKIADGMSPHAVAQTGLLRPRKPDTVYGWLNHYRDGGIAALRAHLHGGRPRGRLRRGAHSGAGAASARSRGGGRAGPAGGRPGA